MSIYLLCHHIHQNSRAVADHLHEIRGSHHGPVTWSLSQPVLVAPGTVLGGLLEKALYLKNLI